MTRIHVIEDSPTQALELQIILEELGYDVTHSSTLAAGLEHLSHRDADLVMLDLMLPDATHLNTLERLQNAIGGGLPVVVLTVLAEKGLAIEALSKGAQDYLNKGKLEPEILDRTLRYAIERHRTQLELRAKNEELERLNTLKNQFLGIATHDLRSPLNIILAYSQILLTPRMCKNLTDKQVEMVHSVQTACQFMWRLVNDLLDISTIEAGRLDLSPVPTDLDALLQANVERNRLLAERKDIDVALEVEEGLPELPLDPFKFEQVLNNLLDNAVKFSEAGSTIAVRAKHVGDQVEVSVSDCGPGIASEDVETLFKPFEKKGTGTQGEKGTGLGLAIVRKIIEKHQGSIRVESAPGEGATFFVSLPLYP